MVNFEDTARTPLIIRAPFKPKAAGTTTAALVMLVDMYPTIAALTGSGTPSVPVDGHDHSALFDHPDDVNGSTSAPYAFTQYPRCPTGGDPSVPAGWAKNYCKSTHNPDIQYMGLSVRDARWRATLWLPWNGTALTPRWDARPTAVELWDYDGSDGSDFDSFPVGHTNLATRPEHAATLQRLLAACGQHFGAPVK